MWGQRRDDASTYLPTLLHPRNPLLLEFSTLDLLLHASSTSASCLPSFFFFPSSLDFPSNSFVSPPLSLFFLRPRCFFFPFFLTFLWGWLHPSCVAGRRLLMTVSSGMLLLLLCRCKICKGIDDEWSAARHALLHYR